MKNLLSSWKKIVQDPKCVYIIPKIKEKTQINLASTNFRIKDLLVLAKLGITQSFITSYALLAWICLPSWSIHTNKLFTIRSPANWAKYPPCLHIPHPLAIESSNYKPLRLPQWCTSPFWVRVISSLLDLHNCINNP